LHHLSYSNPDLIVFLVQVCYQQGLVGCLEEVCWGKHASLSATLVVVHFELTRTATAATTTINGNTSSVHLFLHIVEHFYLQPALGQPGATQHRQLCGSAGISINRLSSPLVLMPYGESPSNYLCLTNTLFLSFSLCLFVCLRRQTVQASCCRAR